MTDPPQDFRCSEGDSCRVLNFGMLGIFFQFYTLVFTSDAGSAASSLFLCSDDVLLSAGAPIPFPLSSLFSGVPDVRLGQLGHPISFLSPSDQSAVSTASLSRWRSRCRRPSDPTVLFFCSGL